MSGKPAIRYVSVAGRGCTLTTESVREIIKRHGSDNLLEVRLATDVDVAWARGMGGHVPDGRYIDTGAIEGTKG